MCSLINARVRDKKKVLVTGDKGSLALVVAYRGVTSCNDRPQWYTDSQIPLVMKLYGPGCSETLIVVQEQAP